MYPRVGDEKRYNFFDCVALHWLLYQAQLVPLQSPLLLPLAVPASQYPVKLQYPQLPCSVQPTQSFM